MENYRAVLHHSKQAWLEPFMKHNKVAIVSGYNDFEDRGFSDFQKT